MNKEELMDKILVNMKNQFTCTSNTFPRQQFIKALQGLSSRCLTISVVADTTNNINKIKHIEFLDPATLQTTIIRF